MWRVKVHQRSKNNRNAFTLIEMVIAMVVLTFIMAGIFGLMRSTTQAAVEIKKSEVSSSQVVALTQLLRDIFGSLPKSSQIKLEIIEGTDPQVQELTIVEAPNLLAYRPEKISKSDTTFGLQRMDQDNYTDVKDQLLAFSFTQEDLIDEDESGLVVSESGKNILTADERGRYWLPMLKNIKSFEWELYNKDNKTWEYEWNSQQLPPFIQIKIQLKDQSQSKRILIPTGREEE